ncbi:MAG TPA: tetratricopeptide repeat protein [bacterium]|nr:tetratricopeptide repeat protein [bacterium]
MKDQTLKIVTIGLSLILILIVSGSKLALAKVEEDPEKKYSYPEHLLPPELQTLRSKIQKLIVNQKYMDAIEEVEKVREKYPDNTFVQITCYQAIAGLYLRLKDYEQALQNIKTYLKLIPPNDENYARYWIDAHWLMAMIYEKLGNYDKASEVSLKLLTKYPDSTAAAPQSTAWLSKYLEKKGESHKIPKTYEDLAKKHPNTPVERTALMTLAQYYEKQKDYKQAALKYQEVMNKYPDTDDALFAESEIKRWEKEGKIKLPLVVAEKVEEVSPEKVVVRGLTRQQLVRLIGIPLVVLIALIYLSILIVRWRKQKK